MRVLQVASSLYDWGGIERYVAYLTQGLTQRGHEVTVVCPPASPLAQRVPTTKVLIGLRRKHAFWLAPRFLREIRQRRYDVVHIHFSPDFLIPAWAARATRQPCVLMTRHVSLPWRPSQVRRVTPLFHGYIAVSQSVERRLVESGISPDRVVVAKAGTPALSAREPRDVARKRLGIGESAVAAGFFGRLVPEKGMNELVAAARLAAGVEVHVFGEGPLGEWVKAHSPKNLTYRGFVPDVADAMQAMDMVVVPSVWEEAFPYSVLEAMSLGRPVVASNIGGLPELVEAGQTGTLVVPGDAPSLAEGIQRLAESGSERLRMGEEAKRRHRETYTVEAMAARIEGAYRRLGAS